MRRVIPAIISTLLCCTGPAWAMDAIAVKQAEDYLERVNLRFEVGTVLSHDVMHAELFVLEMKFKAGTLAKAEYCAQAGKLMSMMIKARHGDREMGVDVAVDRTEEIREAAEIRILCKRSPAGAAARRG